MGPLEVLELVEGWAVAAGEAAVADAPAEGEEKSIVVPGPDAEQGGSEQMSSGLG